MEHLYQQAALFQPSHQWFNGFQGSHRPIACAVNCLTWHNVASQISAFWQACQLEWGKKYTRHLSEEMRVREELFYMLCSKKRKVDNKNRAFNREWTLMLILPTGKAVRRICSDIKSSNVKHHRDTTWHHESPDLKSWHEKLKPTSLTQILKRCWDCFL